MINPVTDGQTQPTFPKTTVLESDKTAIFAKAHPVFNGDTCHYPLLKGLGLALLLGLAIVTIILTTPVGLYFIPFVIAGTAVTLPFFKSSFKKMLFEIGLLHVQLRGKDKWMHVTNEGKAKLYLGAMPLNEHDHVNDFKAKNITKVVSLVEHFEQYSKTFGGTPISNSQWEEAGIEQTLIETSDYHPVSKECLKRAVEIIYNALSNNENVYVHCKAGRGRSASAVVCYFLEYERKALGIPQDAKISMNEVEMAVRYVKNKRDQVSLNSRQKAAILLYFL